MKIELIITSVLMELQGKAAQSSINQEISNRFDRLFADEGWHVLCGVTGARIPYNDLRYWNNAKQVAYASPEISLADHSATSS